MSYTVFRYDYCTFNNCILNNLIEYKINDWFVELYDIYF